MLFGKKRLLPQFFKIATALLLTLCLIRVYEYFAVASKLFVAHPLKFEALGLLYDVWLWFQYCFIVFIFFFPLSLINKKLAEAFFHTLNIIFLVICLALLIIFSERNAPFDHEFFTRNSADTWLTIKQMITSGVKAFLPLFIYLPLYFIVYFLIAKRIQFSEKISFAFLVLSVLSIVFVKYSNPSLQWFNQTSAYYLTGNKMSYWLHNSYTYLTKPKTKKLTGNQLLSEIRFYQEKHPFEFTSFEYPLLHKNNDADVLGSFFDLKKDSLPNIVILVVEGLSKDFSGDNAYAGSFTPFLDSLSRHSLTWDNFLSTAPGTFAAQPAILSSVPYGKKGFSIMNVMPDHLSLIKILKRNGYYTNFMIGFNPDFDNMGGYIRLQGTDFLLSHYGTKYKQMGVGKEGWSMGYPDDALFSRSFEVLDSVNKKPYLSIYHTATTHMPYLFEQKHLYEKLFGQKIKTMKVSAQVKRTLRETKSVITTFMFADDCIKKFFDSYSKRPEFSNTIFLITGDHHIGSFPSTGEVDDYHVPMMMYSPMLKKAHKFYSVNSHNNLTPTILAMLRRNYKLRWQPQNVHWLAGVMDTATQFRNIQSMAFMSWSRDINDYIYKNYFLSGNQLYRLSPQLLEEPVKNDPVKNIMIRLRENFKNINNYVCDNNKVYPAEENFMPGQKVLLQQYKDTALSVVYRNQPDTTLFSGFAIPKQCKYLYVETTADINMNAASTDSSPALRFAIVEKKNNGRNFLYWTNHDLVALSKHDFIAGQWNSIRSNDMFTIDDYKKTENLNFEVGMYSSVLPVNFKKRNFIVRIYGIK